jgi:hypothetical protein
MYSILQTAKLNRVNPEAYLTDTLAKIAAVHPINRISELMPWFTGRPTRPSSNHPRHRMLTSRRGRRSHELGHSRGIFSAAARVDSGEVVI